MANTNEYATLTDIKAVVSKTFLIQLTNFEPDDPFTAILDGPLTEALRDASDEIDSYIAGLTSVPLAFPPDWFKPICIKLAVRTLIIRKGYDSDSSDANHVKEADKCIRKLEMVTKGIIKLGLPTDGTGTSDPSVDVRTFSRTQQFTETELDKIP